MTDAAAVLGMLGRRAARRRARRSTSTRAAPRAASRWRERLGLEVEEVARGRDDDRDRQHGERHPRDHDRAAARIRAARADAVRRRGAAVRDAARRASSRSARSSCPARRQLLRLGPARRRPRRRRPLARASSGSTTRPSRRANDLLAELFAAARRAAGASGEDGERIGLDMRYVGQEHFLTVAAPERDGRVTVDAAGLRDIFTGEYDRPSGTRWTARSRSSRSGDDPHAAAAAGGGALGPRRRSRTGRRPSTRGRSRAASGCPSAVVDRRRSSGSAPGRPRDRARGDRDDLPRRRLAGRRARLRVALHRDRRAEAMHARRRRLPRRPGRRGRRRRRRPDHDRGHPPRAQLGGQPDQARADPHVVLADHLRGPRLRRGRLRPPVPPARAGAEPAASSWGR